ncbi:hypothetical protein WG219_00575 [Ectopseudomonas mendocina]|uniref:Transposase n=1 Tax=Ectopseudomonas mendocina TaxID=300 RepID=A0ABZ2RIZ6_ECTME
MRTQVPLSLIPMTVSHLRERSRFAVPRDGRLLQVILAFWALWHCRHARPPDAVGLC